MNEFFISDTHLNHTNIIKYCNRPFESVEEMNETIIERWNDRISRRDRVWILGDLVPFEKDYTVIRNIVRRLNGLKVLIPGNHDNLNAVDKADICAIDELITEKQFDPNTYIVMCHYKMATWNHSHHGSFHLFGHSHGTIGNKGVDINGNICDTRCMDVGVDTNNFYPYSYEEIVSKLSKIPLPKLD